MVLGVGKHTSHVAIYGETGRFPILLRQKVKVLKYWCRITSMPDSSLIKQTYNSLLSLHRAGFNNYVSNIENMLCNIGFSDLWEAQTCSKKDIECFKRAIHDKHIFDWNNAVNDSSLNPKLRTYCQFKQVYECENYLLTIKDFKIRKCFTKFRVSNHVLAIEKGRHHNISVNDRICDKCNLGLIEDEAHFLMVCDNTMYDGARAQLFSVLDNLGINRDFISILSCEKIQFKLAKCIYKMFKCRDM